MSRTNPIQGKVARVLTSHEIALNKGEVDGVRVEMVFRVLSRKSGDVRDPDTGDILGSVEIEKTRVKITRVHERMSIASTYRTTTVNVGGSGSALYALSGFLQPPRWETRLESLKVSEASIEELDEEDAFVKVGDPVVEHVPVSTEPEGSAV